MKKGELTRKSVEILKYIYRLSEKNASLRDVHIKKIMPFPEITLIVVDKKDIGKVVGKGGRIVNNISRYVKKPVKVISDENFNVLMETILHPAKIKRSGKVFTPEGDWRKIVIDKDDLKKISPSLNIISKIMEELLNERVELTVE